MKINPDKKIFGIVLLAVFLFVPTQISAKTLKVPFLPQSPYENWQQPWKDACEEASISMVDSFFKNESASKQLAKSKILNIFAIKNKIFGYSLDENAEKIVKLINNYLPWSASILENPTILDIKKEIDNERPVIVPVYGKALKNPNFRLGGPIYHVLVIAGYDDEKQEFITEEPGTRRGLDFRYSYDTIMDANHDFLPNNKTKEGPKKIILTNPNLEDTESLDPDNDGLSKVDEIKHGTATWLADTDKDGYSDGTEVASGFSPLLAEAKLKNGSLIKIPDDKQVYLLKNKTKQPIAKIFKNAKINVVSEIFLLSLKDA